MSSPPSLAAWLWGSTRALTWSHINQFGGRLRRGEVFMDKAVDAGVVGGDDVASQEDRAWRRSTWQQ